MKSKDFQYTPKSRRGLSTIVGALLFVVLMVATFSVLGIALNSQTDIVQTSRDVTDLGLAQQQEDFDLVSITQAAGDDLDVSLINNGQNAAEMFTMIMTNKSVAGEPTQTFSIPSDTSFLAPSDELPTDIVETLNIIMNTPTVNVTETYDFKVISSLGTIKKLRIECTDDGVCGPLTGPIGTGALSVQLFLDGPTGINGKTSTVIMFVQNTGDATILNVEPVRTCAAMVTTVPPGGTHTFDSCVVTPASYPALADGAVAIFKYDGIALCAVGDVYNFENAVQGDGVPDSNFDDDTLECIDPNDCGPGGCGPGGDDGIILIDDLLIRPSIFMVIPSPFGTADKSEDYTGLWGVNLANPTDEPMSISKVTIVAYPPGGLSQDNVVDGKSDDCNQEDIQPNLGPQPFGFWSCPRDNIMLWQNVTHPLILEANSTQSFMVRTTPAGIKPGPTEANLDALIVQANVYSTFGSFGKAGYQSTMYLEETGIINVYLSDTIDSITDFQGNRNDITENSTETFIIVLADLDDDTSTWVESGARLVINIPREWTFEGFNSCDGFDAGGPCDDPTVVVHNDGSTQIIGTTLVPIGDATFQARSISFDAKAPDVDAPRLYVMYVLADGIVLVDGDEKTIGPLNEIVLNVDP